MSKRDDRIASLERENAELRARLDACAEELRDTQEHFRLVGEAVAEGIYDWNIAQNRLWVSPRLIALFGWETGSSSAGNRPSQDWGARVHPDDFEHYRAALRGVLKHETPRMRCEYRIRVSSGDYRWVEDHAVPAFGTDGRATRLAGAVSDITERKEVERALHELNRLKDESLADLNAVIDTIDYAVLFMGPDLRARVINRAFREMWGIPDSFIATGPTMADLIEYNRHNGLYDVPEAEFDAFVARRVEAIQAGNIAPVEVCRADGRILRYGGVVLPDGGRMLTYLDITDAKRRETELSETLDRQTATSDILRAIAASPGDAEGTLRKIAETTARLFGAAGAAFMIAEGDEFTQTIGVGRGVEQVIAALYGPGGSRPRVSERTMPGIIIREDRQIHLPDLDNLPAELADWPGPPIMRARGVRAVAGTPLRREGQAIGVLVVERHTPQPFAAEELQLLQSFADQAVIAIENARLIIETREALEQQTATAEVLGVINASPGDLTPVFDAMLEKAVRLCEAAYGVLWTYDGRQMTASAVHASAEIAMALRELGPTEPQPGSLGHRLLQGEAIVHIANAEDDQSYRMGSPSRRVLVELGKARALLGIALRKDDAVLGLITVYRQETRPFTDKQIALLQNFAAQAVIAIENARLITETRLRTEELQESLDYQTATSDVLKVISRSTFDLQPVLETVVATAARLCRAEKAIIYRHDDGVLRYAAGFSNQAEYERIERETPIYPGEGSVAGRAALHKQTVQIVDALADPLYMGKEEARIGNARSMIGVPLMREGALVGVIALARGRVERFADKEIELVTTFADQAVIAIENVRLITETQEALDQQTATAEVLQVINSSPGNLAPVFDAVLDKALLLCRAPFGVLFRYDGQSTMHLAATRGVSFEQARWFQQWQPRPGDASYEIIKGASFLQIPDLIDTDVYRTGLPSRVKTVEVTGARTMLWIALRKDATLLGAFAIYRREVRPFTEKQVALLQNFAAQAVIAMENARLLDEIRQRQAELRVTFDNMGDGVVMFDQGLRLAAWNRNFQELLDLPDALLEERKTYAEYLHILAARGEFGPGDVEAELNRRLAHADEELRFERTRPDGRVLEVRRNAVAGGGFVLIYSDITERKRSEEEIRAARDAAEAALRDLQTAQSRLIQAEKMASLGQLTAGIAHEIKNPLNFVNNFAALSNELLSELREVAEPAIAALAADKRDELDETMAMLSGNLEKIAEHGKRADNIVKSMLEHSRGVSGERRAVDLNALVEESLNLAYHGARAQDQSFNITLEREFDQKLQPIELVPQDMTRVFLNLIGNGFYAANKRAQKSGNGFRPVLRVATHEAGDVVEVRVRDNGTGIPADIRDKLFQPFFTTKPTGEGTGLGLSISYDIVTQQHGGTIAVDSAQDEFTEFTIRLPRQALQTRAGR